MSGATFDANYYFSRYLAQVAAEPYIKVVGLNGNVTLLDGVELRGALKFLVNRKYFGSGKNGHTQLTGPRIQEFLTTYQLVDQWADCPTPIGNSFTAPLTLADATVIPFNTGFSATLMTVRDRPGEHVFAIRSTEFSGWEKGGEPRDGSEVDMYGITARGGCAWTQIDAMRSYAQWLREQNMLPIGSQVHFTGYSLGKHLVVAFEKLNGAGQGGSSMVDGTTFNAPGLGSANQCATITWRAANDQRFVEAA